MNLHPDARVPILTTFLLQSLSSVGLILLDAGNSIFLKTFLAHLAAFLFSLIPAKSWSQFLFTPESLSKEQSSSSGALPTLFSLKSRALLRIAFASFFTFLSSCLWFYSKGTSPVANTAVFCINRLMVAILFKSIKSSKPARVLSFTLLSISSIVLSLATTIKLWALVFSTISSYLSLMYIKLLVPSFHSESSVITAVLLISSALSLVLGIIFESFRASCAFWPAFIGGLFVWATPHFLFFLRKSLPGNGLSAIYTVWPFLIASLANRLLASGTETPFAAFFCIVLAFVGARFLSFSFGEAIVMKPFSTAKSTIHFFVSLILILFAICQYLIGLATGELWRIADAIYFVGVLKWTMSEVLKMIHKSSNPEFSYGFGRITQILEFGIGIFSALANFHILMYFLRPIHPSSPSSFHTVYPFVFAHLLLAGFFLWSPRNSNKPRGQSIINAVNFNTASDMERPYKPDLEFLDFAVVILSILGGFAHGFLLDRLVALLIIGLSLYLAVPIMVQSAALLMQALPDTAPGQLRSIRAELGQVRCVKEIVSFRVWQNDEALSVGTIVLKIDEKLCQKPQDLLMYIISLCQQSGILDVTVEVIGQDSRPLVANRGFQLGVIRSASPI
jgi:Co/Zn/Cd efflux system component